MVAIPVLVGILVLVLVVAWLSMGKNSGGGSPSPTAPKAESKLKVYGSMSCGWTKKQLEHLGSRAEFIDCTTQQCPSFVTGYPTIEDASGNVTVGYSSEI